MKKLFLLVFPVLLAASCTPEEGPGGTAKINGLAAHHSLPIPDTKIWIKYGTSESPGIDTQLYDDSTQAGQDGRFEFSGLQKGVYYLYGIGYDSTIDMPVTAGIPVVLAEKGQVKEVLLPVTE